MSDNFNVDKESIQSISNGIKKVVSLVSKTYGAAGGNVIIPEQFYPFYRITNDGKIIVDSVNLENNLEKFGALILKEGANAAERDSADGRKTTMLLTGAIIEELGKVQGYPMDIKRSLDECLPIIMESISKETNPVKIEEIAQVATIASESAELGNIIQEIYTKIGKEGIIELDNSNTFETFYEIKEGVRLRNAGFMAPYMQNDGDRSVFDNPYVLITKQKIGNMDDLKSLITQLKNNGIHELVIFCEDIETAVLGGLAVGQMSGHFKALVIKAPTLWKDWLFEDFAKITGATVIDIATGVSLKTVGLKHLGTCDKIISTKDETTVLGIKDIKEHIKDLTEKSLKNDQLKVRLQWLNTAAAVLKVGSNSETDLGYKSKKAKDGISSSYLALREGVVVGGGISLVNAAKSLPDTVGGRILKVALCVPAVTIITNANIETFDIGGEMGVNVRTGKIVNMKDAGIMDASLVVKNAVKNSISIASTALTINGVITEPNVK